MATPWKVKQNEYERGPRGEAVVRVGESKVKVVFTDENGQEDSYILKKENCPDNVRAGKWMVTLSGNKDKMFSIWPIKGAFTVRFVGMAHAEGSLPAPKLIRRPFVDKKTGQSGVSEYLAFTMLFEITEGPNKGMQISKFLRYYFGESEGKVIFIKPKSDYCTELMNYLEALGVFKYGEMEYSENILPALEKRIKKANHKLLAVMNKGYMDSISEIVDTEAEGEDEDDLDEKPKPAPKAKAKAQVVDDTDEDDFEEIEEEEAPKAKTKVQSPPFADDDEDDLD